MKWPFNPLYNLDKNKLLTFLNRPINLLLVGFITYKEAVRKLEKTYRKLLEPKYTDVKVLYVEDEGYFREKLLRVLNRRFAEVYSAVDSIEGYELYQKYKPDIIITDFKIKQFSGLEMVEKIRKINDKVQVIVTTSNEDYDIFIHSIDIFNHYVFKPIHLDHFWIAIQKAVYQIRLEKELRKQKKLTKSIIDSHDQIIFISEKGEIVEFNQAFSSLTGMNRNQSPIKDEVISNYFVYRPNYFYPKNKKKWIEEFLENGRSIANVCWETKEKNVSLLMKAASMKELDQVLFIGTDITRAEKETNEMEILATIDPLTRCYNQQKFDEILSKEMIDSEQFNHHFSLILLTVNHIKDITDQFGFQEADNMLVIISTIIQQRIREIDILARWTDEEFILLLPDTELQDAKELAESIQSIIGNFRFQKAGFITCCLGISEFQTGTSKHRLLLEAKQGLIESENYERYSFNMQSKDM